MNLYWNKFLGFDDVEAIDLAFADFALRRSGGAGGRELFLGALLASRAVRRGAPFCDLRRFAGTHFPADHPESFALPEFAAWIHALSSAPCAAAVSVEPEIRPTVLVLCADGGLALHRYYQYENELFRQIRCRAALPPDDTPVTAEQLRNASPRFAAVRSKDFQVAAVLTAVREYLAVVTGGPGTGKSTVVEAIVKLFAELHPGARIALTAPTGKAQARLASADSTGDSGINITRTTLHRLLGCRPDSGEVRYTPERPLPYDLVVVDELSMVSLPLLSKFFAALPERSHAVLLGDGEQLPAVELGGAFKRILAMGEVNHMRRETGDIFAAYCGSRLEEPFELLALDGHVIELERNYRSASAPAIVHAAQLIRRRAPVREILDALTANASPDLVWRPLDGTGTPNEEIRRFAEPLRARIAAANSAEETLELYENYALLSPLRNGPCGTLELGKAFGAALGPDSPAPFPHKMPVIILANDPETGLANGDVGVIWQTENEPAQAVFRAAQGFQRFRPAALPAYESALALTIHKSQGSGYADVLAVLPEMPGKGAELLSRELLYTALTRAAERFILLASQATLRRVLERA